jgi:hypothetical protein
MNDKKESGDMKVWAIRVKGTQKYLPYGHTSHTFSEPMEGESIRFHPTKRGAANTLSTWLQGYHNFSFREGERYIKRENRKREDMEIVEYDLTEVK